MLRKFPKSLSIDAVARALFLVYLAESAFGSSGKLISFGPLSLRMLLFGLCFAASLPAVVRNLRHLAGNGQVLTTVILGVYWLVCAGVGVFSGNALGLVWADVSTMMALALVPGFLAVMAGEGILNRAMDVIFWSAAALGAVSVVLHFAMANVTEEGFDLVNDWINARSLGGLAYMASGIQRIYFKSQIFLQVAIVYGVWKLGDPGTKKRLWIYAAMGVLFCAWVLSYTRGFWLGLVISAALVLLLCPWQWKLYLKASGAMLAVFAVFLALSSLVYSGPRVVYEILGRTDASLLAEKDNVQSEKVEMDADGDGDVSVDEANDAASMLRGQSLKLIWQRIGENPVFGSGLGENLDEIRSDGKVEYMYHDIWMKTGLVGLLLFLGCFFGFLVPQIRQELRNRGSRPQWRDPRIRNRFLTAAYLGVALTSWFNPFLTNPMGISLLMLTATAVYTTINDYRK
jgi:hypothetical protein